MNVWHTCAEKFQYDPASDTIIWTASPKDSTKGKQRPSKVLNSDQLVAHLPPRRVQLVRRYGVYAGKVRKQWQERPNIYSLAPESWQRSSKQTKLFQSHTSGETGNCPGLRFLSKLRKQVGHGCYRKSMKLTRFVSQNVGTMSFVAIIEDPKELAKIINGQNSRNGSNSGQSVLVHLLSLLLV